MLDHFIPFQERVRFSMLRAALDEGVTAKEMAKRTGYKLAHVRHLVMGENADPTLRELSDWHYCLNGKVPKITLIEIAGETTCTPTSGWSLGAY